LRFQRIEIALEDRRQVLLRRPAPWRHAWVPRCRQRQRPALAPSSSWALAYVRSPCARPS
jgi:hypothetical protein